MIQLVLLLQNIHSNCVISETEVEGERMLQVIDING